MWHKGARRLRYRSARSHREGRPPPFKGLNGSPAKRKTEVSASSVSNPIVSLRAHVVSASLRSFTPGGLTAPVQRLERFPCKRKEVLSSTLKSASGISTRTAAILPRNGVAPWGRFCIFRGGERGRGKNERQRGGGCAKPLRGQAPVTPNSLILRSFHLATRYKSEIFVERDPREMANLPESQIFKT